MADSLNLHSGDYVERYKRKSLRRVQNLLRRMRVGNDDELGDFACGTGMLLHVLGTRRGQYHGIDFSPDFIAAAKEWANRSGLQNWQFHCRDIVDFCAEHPNRFDVGAALDFSEHVDDDEASRIFDAIRNSLRTGGRLYIHTPNREFFMEELKAGGVLRQFPEHIAVRTPRQMRSLLVEAGFDQGRITIEIIPHYNILRLVHPLRHLPVFGKYLRARLWITARA